MEFSQAKLYIVFVGVLLLLAGVIALYTAIENYFNEKSDSKRKVRFKTQNKKTKGYWKTERGEEYDENLKIED